MQTKVCTKCGVEKPRTEFYKRNTADGRRADCKSCVKSKVAQNRERLGKEFIREQNQFYYTKNRDKLIEYAAERRLNSPEKCKISNKNKPSASPEAKREYNRKYYEKNKSSIMDYNKAWVKMRKANDPEFLMHQRMRSSIGRWLKVKTTNYSKWEQLLGYTRDELVSHIESLFVDGMTWDNYGRGGWHIDHIIPLSQFEFTDVTCEGFVKAWSLDNLQPLWAKDNLRKGAKVGKEWGNV